MTLSSKNSADASQPRNSTAKSAGSNSHPATQLENLFSLLADLQREGSTQAATEEQYQKRSSASALALSPDHQDDNLLAAFEPQDTTAPVLPSNPPPAVIPPPAPNLSAEPVSSYEALTSLLDQPSFPSPPQPISSSSQAIKINAEEVSSPVEESTVQLATSFEALASLLEQPSLPPLSQPTTAAPQAAVTDLEAVSNLPESEVQAAQPITTNLEQAANPSETAAAMAPAISPPTQQAETSFEALARLLGKSSLPAISQPEVISDKSEVIESEARSQSFPTSNASESLEITTSKLSQSSELTPTKPPDSLEITTSNPSQSLELTTSNPTQSSELTTSNPPESLDLTTSPIFQQSNSSLVNSELEDQDPLDLLRNLLMTPELAESHQVILSIEQKLQSLEYQIYQPEKLIKLLLPLITDLLSMKVAESRQAMAESLAPAIDEMIQAKIQQDRNSMSSALAPVLSEAVAQGVADSPGDFAKALAPEMGSAIKEQINLERDAMVDALYPVIGSTISKYMGEAIREINEKVETTFSPEGLSRKIRSKMQGVSEAELIFKESMLFSVQAVFLIHKGSGLVMAEAQSSGSQRLESEMVAGMLTAIRSFVNDCIAQSGDISELDQIDYGNSKIVLEVAGYCYLTVALQGEPPQKFIQQIRKTLIKIVQRYDKQVELYDGDPDTIPPEVTKLLEELIITSSKEKAKKAPAALLVIGSVLLGLIFIPWGIHQYRQHHNQVTAAKTSLALTSEPELAVYRLNVEADGDKIKLSGKLPNEYLRSKAGEIAQASAPKSQVNNQILAVDVPPDPILAAAEVQRVTTVLNQLPGVAIATSYQEGKVRVQGVALLVPDVQKITSTFEKIPGVRSVAIAVELNPLAASTRIYFDPNSAELIGEASRKIQPIKEFLTRYPELGLRIVGHSDRSGNPAENQQLALKRAQTIRNALISQGITPERLEFSGIGEPPQDVDASQPQYLGRCVEFIPLAANTRKD
jgi:outer membrane protein OmpA-like peptidoglycan-associated protein